MHGYHLRLRSEERERLGGGAISPGAIYAAIKRLTADGFVQRGPVEREGALPERQVVEITGAGRVELLRLRRQVLADVTLPFTHVQLVLALPGQDCGAWLPQALELRRTKVVAQLIAQERARVPELNRVSALNDIVFRHSAAMLRAEADFLERAAKLVLPTSRSPLAPSAADEETTS